MQYSTEGMPPYLFGSPTTPGDSIKMATHNDITGDALISRTANSNYRNNYDLIFGKKNKALSYEPKAKSEDPSKLEAQSSKLKAKS